MDSLDQVLAAYEAGQAEACLVIANAAHYLGISLANLIGIMNIQKIILTGDMTRFGSGWMEMVRTSMQAAALSRMSEGVHLEMGTLDYRACILGASAHLVLNDYSLLFTRED